MVLSTALDSCSKPRERADLQIQLSRVSRLFEAVTHSVVQCGAVVSRADAAACSLHARHPCFLALSSQLEAVSLHCGQCREVDSQIAAALPLCSYLTDLSIVADNAPVMEVGAAVARCVHLTSLVVEKAPANGWLPAAIRALPALCRLDCHSVTELDDDFVAALRLASSVTAVFARRSGTCVPGLRLR